MIEHLTSLSFVESEVVGQHRDEGDGSHKNHKVRHISVTLGVEGIITQLIAVRFVMSVRLVNNKVGVRVGREDVLVTEIK